MLRHLRLGGVAYSAGGESGLPSFIHPTSRRETVWKVGGGFLIACVSCFKRARWDIFALFWLLAILQIEAYWDFPDSLSTYSGEQGLEGGHPLQAQRSRVPPSASLPVGFSLLPFLPLGTMTNQYDPIRMTTNRSSITANFKYSAAWVAGPNRVRRVPENPTTSAIEPAINTVLIMAPSSLLTHPRP